MTEKMQQCLSSGRVWWLIEKGLHQDGKVHRGTGFGDMI